MSDARQDPVYDQLMQRAARFVAARAARPQFLVVRHGRDAANQPDEDRRPLGLLPAPDAASAVSAAGAKWSLFDGQRFEVVPAEALAAYAREQRRTARQKQPSA